MMKLGERLSLSAVNVDNENGTEWFAVVLVNINICTC